MLHSLKCNFPIVTNSIDTMEEDDDEDCQTLQCKICSKSYPILSILKHFARSQCSNQLDTDYIESVRKLSKERQKQKQKKTKGKYYQDNKSSIKQKRKLHYETNKEDIAVKKAKYYNDQKEMKKDCIKHRSLYFNEIEFGPIYPCVSCNRDLFFRGVQYFSEDLKTLLESENMMNFIDLAIELNGKRYICHNCKNYLAKKEMPPLNFQNGLRVSKAPDCLKNLKPLEKQLIKKNLPFLKVRKLPKTQMEAMNDKVVNVPISDDDLIKNVESLPRTKETNGIINLKMKRRLKQKSYYKMETARPDIIYESLYYLKENNPFYANIKLIPYEKFLEE